MNIISFRVYRSKDDKAGQICHIDSENAHLLKRKWKLNRGGYAARNRLMDDKNTSTLLHRVIMGCQKGDPDVDHIDGNRLNNCRTNLRFANTSQNQRNRLKTGLRSSQFKGVTWCKRLRKWQAQVKDGRKNVYLGVFESEIEAAKAYDAACQKIDPVFFRTNRLAVA